jgi:predicted nucleotidyltransferase
MTSPARTWDIDQVRRIVLTRLRDYSVDVYWFGSTAKGTAGRYSDIDVAILPHKRLPAGLLAEIREDLEQSHVIYQVDVVDLSQAPEKLRDSVIKEGTRWGD